MRGRVLHNVGLVVSLEEGPGGLLRHRPHQLGVLRARVVAEIQGAGQEEAGGVVVQHGGQVLREVPGEKGNELFKLECYSSYNIKSVISHRFKKITRTLIRDF